jgi:hypothetical protein
MLSTRVKLKAYVQYRILKKFYSKTSKIQPFTEILEENLFQCPVTVTSKNGKDINLNAVFQVINWGGHRRIKKLGMEAGH